MYVCQRGKDGRNSHTKTSSADARYGTSFSHATDQEQFRSVPKTTSKPSLLLLIVVGSCVVVTLLIVALRNLTRRACKRTKPSSYSHSSFM
mmetsp:Transcript_52403/g.78288  ORF Transcript_52403/g.78288 Transcript_52403/m.78288 type:complete len:91 (-) Transcript_52403:82-354(-)